MWTQGISWSLLGEPLGPVAQWGTCLDEAQAFIAGVRSPPLRGGLAQHGWPHGENPGITRRAVSSEGRGLRARMARPKQRRGIPFPPRGLTGAAGPKATCIGQPRATFAGVRSPPLQGASLGERPWGGKPGTARKAAFSEGRGLRARVARPYSCQGISSREMGGQRPVA